MSEESIPAEENQAEEEATPTTTTASVSTPAGTAPTVAGSGLAASSVFTMPSPHSATTVLPTPSRPKAKTKGRKSVITKEFWIELKTMYETGSYTQRDLVDYCRARGIRVSQSLVARKCMDEGWTKGARLEQIKKDIYEQIAKEKGDAVIKMLNQHRAQANMVMAEALFHFRKAGEQRKVDPHYCISSVNLATLTQLMAKAQEMEARALGFNYKEGRPFTNDDEEAAEKPTELVIRTMTAEEAAEVQRRAEAAAHGDE